MLEVKDLSTDNKICKIFQIHKDDYEYVDSFLISYSDGELTVHTTLFSSIELAESRCHELLIAETITTELLTGDLS